MKFDKETLEVIKSALLLTENTIDDSVDLITLHHQDMLISALGSFLAKYGDPRTWNNEQNRTADIEC